MKKRYVVKNMKDAETVIKMFYKDSDIQYKYLRFITGEFRNGVISIFITDGKLDQQFYCEKMCESCTDAGICDGLDYTRRYLRLDKLKRILR